MIDFSEIQRRITSKFPVEELEKRLRPQKPEFEKGKWSDYSGGGFLAPNESLMAVVRADYDTLGSLGKSYEEMAKLAANYLEQFSRESYPRGNRLTRSLNRFVARHWKPVANIDRKKFMPMGIGSMGSQSCPWECKGKDTFGYRTFGSGQIYIMEKGKESSDLMERWISGEEDIVEFGGIDRVLYLSAFTVITDLTPHLIASHYFFEGDSSYRTDPKKLLQVTGME